MTTEDDFIRMIASNPEDYTTWLILADWYKDRDDEVKERICRLLSEHKFFPYWSARRAKMDMRSYCVGNRNTWKHSTYDKPEEVTPMYRSLVPEKYRSLVPEKWIEALIGKFPEDSNSTKWVFAATAFDCLKRILDNIPARLLNEEWK